MLLTLLAPIGALSALVFAFVMARRVLKLPEGNDQMKKISLAVRRGANAYLRRQYLGVAVFFPTCFPTAFTSSFGSSPFFPGRERIFPVLVRRNTGPFPE